jgi:hypothetical protein
MPGRPPARETDGVTPAAFSFQGLKAMNVSRSERIQGKISCLLAEQILVNRNRLWAVILFVVPDLTFSAGIQLNKRV